MMSPTIQPSEAPYNRGYKNLRCIENLQSTPQRPPSIGELKGTLLGSSTIQPPEALLLRCGQGPRRLENLPSSPPFSHSKTTHRKLPTAPTSTK